MGRRRYNRLKVKSHSDLKSRTSGMEHRRSDRLKLKTSSSGTPPPTHNLEPGLSDHLKLKTSSSSASGTTPSPPPTHNHRHRFLKFKSPAALTPKEWMMRHRLSVSLESRTSELRRSDRLKSKTSSYAREFLNLFRNYPFFCDPPYTASDLQPHSQILKKLKKSLFSQTPTDQVSSPLAPSSVVLPSYLQEGLGMVVGKLTYWNDGYKTDCSEGGITGGHVIPFDINGVKNIKSDALFILLISNQSAFMSLAEDRFFIRFPCIMVTPEGPPDFLLMIQNQLSLPVLALLDSDPQAINILCFYGRVLKSIKWLGIRPTDLLKHQMMEDDLNRTLPMTEEDIKIGNELLEDDFVNQNPKWREELETMLRTKQKAEIEALSCFDYTYLNDVFLPIKLQQGDWI